jgi:hypothetical protein
MVSASLLDGQLRGMFDGPSSAWGSAWSRRSSAPVA